MAQNFQIDRNVRMVWKGPQVEAAIRRVMINRTVEATSMLTLFVVTSISVPVVAGSVMFTRSKPGEYPRKDTGNLRHSIKMDVSEHGLAIVGKVSTDVPYGWYLEKSLRREFLSRALKENTRAIVQIFRQKVVI